jgi:hypothetical protein
MSKFDDMTIKDLKAQTDEVKKLVREANPFYQQVWFVIASNVVTLLASVGITYFVMKD